MRSNTKLLLLGLVACGGVLIACGDSGNTGGAGGTTSSTTTGSTSSSTVASSNSSSSSKASSSTGMTNPTPPTLGAQIDRMGRPAINTATDETFLAVNGAQPTPSTDALRGAAEDAYNADATPLNWTDNQKTMKAQLAILDALDGVCGNQAFACGTTTADLANPACYATLAGVLADDRLWMTTKATATCTTYLGVETQADDCGGRRPVDDVIKSTYSVVAGVTFDDGITAPSGLHPTTFPYLAAPH